MHQNLSVSVEKQQAVSSQRTNNHSIVAAAAAAAATAAAIAYVDVLQAVSRAIVRESTESGYC